MNYKMYLGALIFAMGAFSGGAWAHPGGHDGTYFEELAARSQQHFVMMGQNDTGEKVSGQGELKFRVFATSATLPKEAIDVLVNAHGGFGVDRRKGQGEIYFALPKAGIIKISSDLKHSAMLPTDPAMRDTNMHNANVWYDKDGKPFLVFPGNEANQVFTTTLDGKLVHTLNPPENFDFGNDIVNKWFSDPANKFIPTDVEQLANVYYITTGYSKLDFVLTADIESTDPFKAGWKKLAFGGKGDNPGQFQTGHGITVTPDHDRLVISDRPKSELDRFTADGQYEDTVMLPQGSLPCDVAFESGYVVVGCLEGPDKNLGAPIYILKDDKVVSTIMPKEELGLTNFVHVHNATMVTVNGKLYIVAQAWKPGDFAILEQVK